MPQKYPPGIRRTVLFSFFFPSFFGSTYITNEIGATSRKSRKPPKMLQKYTFSPILLHHLGVGETGSQQSIEKNKKIHPGLGGFNTSQLGTYIFLA